MLTLRDYLDVVARRKWTILATMVVLAGAAVAISLAERPLYSATADVLLSRQGPLEALTNAPGSSSARDLRRAVATQAQVARSPVVARRALKAAHITAVTPRQFLKNSKVTSVGDTDVLRFETRQPTRKRARRLATAYANQFRLYRQELDVAQVKQARSRVTAALNQLAGSAGTDSPQAQNLLQQETQLETLEGAVKGNVQLISPATRDQQVRPKPVRAGALLGAMGLVFGVLLAFVRDSLDTRVHSARQASRLVDMPLLGMLYLPRRSRMRRNAQRSRLDPHRELAEPSRNLRTHIELAGVDAGVRTLMVTSAGSGEGKSAVVLDLATSFASAGYRVAIVELDMRRPSLASRVGIEGGTGWTDVVEGRREVEDVLVSLPFGSPSSSSNGDAPTAGTGSVELMAAGHVPPDPGGALRTPKLLPIIRDRIAQRADLVLIDAPALLEFSDGLRIAHAADGVVAVARLGVIRRRALSRLREALDALPAPVLGLVVTGAKSDDADADSRSSIPVRAVAAST